MLQQSLRITTIVSMPYDFYESRTWWKHIWTDCKKAEFLFMLIKRVRWFISLFENITQQCQLLWNSNQPSISILHRFKWIKTFAGLGGLGHRVSGHALERPRCASQCRPCPWIAGSQKPNRSRPPFPGLPGTSPAGTPSQRGREKSPPP